MDVTRGIAGKQNHHPSGRKRSKTVARGGLAPWSHMIHDVLFLIMMKLGMADFIAFSSVCKSWRALAHSNWNIFMSSRKPMRIFIPTGDKECHFEDSDGRMFKTIIPHATDSSFLGITRGYLILLDRRTRDFWLVNPITRHEFHFPRVTFRMSTDSTNFKGFLIHSPSMSGWVFVLFVIHPRSSSILSFSLAGSEVWTYLPFDFPIYDVHEFQGKIYTLHTGGHFYEVGINSDRTMTLLGNVGMVLQQENCTPPHFANSGKTLYMMYWNSDAVPPAPQVHFDKIKCVTKETLGEYAYFVSDWNCAALIKLDTWADPWIHYERIGLSYGRIRCSFGTEQSKIEGWCSRGIMWYFPHDCLNVNLV